MLASEALLLAVGLLLSLLLSPFVAGGIGAAGVGGGIGVAYWTYARLNASFAEVQFMAARRVEPMFRGKEVSK